jgi:hypothetical protein
MPREIIYAARNASVTINTSNQDLDGNGAMSSLITASSNGTLIKTIIIKAQVTTQPGMVRFFINSGGSKRLLTEITISTVTISSRDASFYEIIQLGYLLKAGDSFEVSTETNDTFNIIMDALDISYYSTYREDTAYVNANTGVNVVSTANGNLNGGGAIQSIITGGGQGCVISSIIVKGQMTTSPGMVRFFIDDSSGWVLFAELPIPAVTQGATQQTFIRELISYGSMTIGPGVIIGASTQVNQTFSIIMEGADWDYLP